MARKRLRSTTKPAREAEFELFERGWKPLKGGLWRHANLDTDWPTDAALRLQDEADAGMMDKVHRDFRGDHLQE